MQRFNSAAESVCGTCDLLFTTVVRRRPRSLSALPFAGRGASCPDLRPALRPLRLLFVCIGFASALWLALAHSASAQGTSFEVSNIGQATASQSSDLGDNDVLQRFRTAAHIDAYTGYTVTSVGIEFGAVSSPNSVPTVSILKTATASHPERKIADLTPPTSLSANSVNTWTATGIQLEPYTFYAVRVDSAGGQSNRGNRIRQTSSGSEASSGVSGWHISDQFLHRGASGGQWHGTSRSLKIRISGTANPAVAPDVASVTRHSPSASPTNADSVVWRVAFSKAVRNVDATDFTVSGTTATIAVAAADGEGVAYDVTLSGGNLADLDATVTLSVASGHNVEDLDGRALSGTTPTGRNDNAYVIDNTGPTILHVRPRSDMQNVTNADTLVWHVTFSEPIVNLQASSIYFADEYDHWLFIMRHRGKLQRLTGAVYEISVDHELGDLRWADVLWSVMSPPVGDHFHGGRRGGHQHGPKGDHTATYTAHLAGASSFDVRDMAGNLLATELQIPGPPDVIFEETSDHALPSYESKPIHLDIEAPALTLVEVNGAAITLTYDESLDAASVPAAAAFAVRVAGAAASLAETNPVAVAGNRVTLTLASAVAPQQAVRLDYTAPGSDPIRDPAGNNAANIGNRTVTGPLNPDIEGPVLTLARVHGTTIALTYDERLNAASVPAAAAFAVRVAGAAASLAENNPVTVAGNRVTLTLASAVTSDQAVRLDYTAPDSHPIRDPAGNNAANLENQAVTVSASPVGSNGPVTAIEDLLHICVPANFGIRDTGNRATRSTLKITSLPAAGTGTLNVDGRSIKSRELPKTVTKTDLDAGKLTYSPPSDANGGAFARFTFKVNDDDNDNTLVFYVAAVNDPATGAPAISGVAREGEELTADVSGIADDADGLTKAANGDAGYAFSYQWLRVTGTGDSATEAAIDGATASTYRLVQADVGKKVKVQVSFTDDDGHGETLTSAVYPSSGSVSAGITAAFEDLPQSHDGATRFSVRLAFSRNIASLSYQWLRDHLLSATGGRVVSAKRETRGENRNWLITLAPSGTDDVTLRLAALPCGTQYAVCEDGTPLAEAVSATVAYDGEAPETPEPEVETFGAELVLRTHSHNGAGGSGKFNLYFRSDPHELSYRHLAARALLISGGAVSRAKRFPPGQNRVWEVTVAPEGNEDIGVALKTTTDCDTGICTADGAMFASDSTLTIPGPSLFSVADAQVEEAEGAALVFTVTLSRARTHHSSWVSYATADGTATAGSDYTATSGRLTFAAGETSKTVRVAVLDDTHDEGDETLTLTLSSPIPAGYTRIGDGVATGTIRNTDAMPKAWTARFGRTVAEQVLETVDSRMQAARTPGVEVTVAGARLDGQTQTTEASGAGEAAAGQPLALADWLRDATDPNAEDPRSRAISNRDLLLGSTFLLTAADDAPGTGGATYSLWGRGAVSSFDGRDDDLTMDGEVVSAMLGADWSRGHVLAGLIVGHSSGDGGYRASAGAGMVSSTLTGLYPWGRYALSERLSVWAAAGYGEGRLTLTPDGQDAIRADLDLWMGAIGLRGALVDGGANGLSLTSKTDALLVETSTAAVAGLAATASGVTRLRLAVEGTLPVRLSNGWVVTPAVELGLRHDGGDAETGFGLDVGAGLAWRAERLGLSAEIRGRGLVTHEASGFRDVGLSGSLAWRPAVDDRGPSLSLAQTYGGSSTGGVGALLERGTLSGLSATGAGEALDGLHRQRLEARFGYGVSAFGDRFTWIPEVGVGVSETARDYRLGWRLVRVARGSASAGGRLELSLEAMRRESASDAAAGPEHAVGMRLTSPF